MLHPLAFPVADLNVAGWNHRRWSGLGAWEVGRGGAEGGVQVPGCQRNDREHGPEDGELERGVVADRLDREDEAGYEGNGERDSPVEAACPTSMKLTDREPDGGGSAPPVPPGNETEGAREEE
jgi:hypothetical protein